MNLSRRKADNASKRMRLQHRVTATRMTDAREKGGRESQSKYWDRANAVTLHAAFKSSWTVEREREGSAAFDCVSTVPRVEQRHRLGFHSST